MQDGASHHIHPFDGKQSEIEQQGFEVAHVRHFQCGEMGDNLGHYLSLFRNLLDDGEILPQSMVKTD